MAKPASIVLLVFILVTIVYLLSRSAPGSAPGNNGSVETGSRSNPLFADQPLVNSSDGPPSKSGTRTARLERKTITTASGLQYEVLAEGSGPRPSPTDTVLVHYHGTTLDGTVFDSSIERGKPTPLPLNLVIKGWTEGLQLMRVGAKYKFTMPPHLAYGERGAGKTIGPNETLVFEVELLEIPPKP